MSIPSPFGFIEVRFWDAKSSVARPIWIDMTAPEAVRLIAAGDEAQEMGFASGSEIEHQLC
ncbi:hypothetical protein [Pandoraea terrigena]|uniref:Uncharacterized protein n=1 Tax=Pandoraea terrigena TaxID=2508292 RepID=A0A5E4REG0_9BURK|nr:hypothetical protein [Pandoraea terrigena]VVD60894.1 hypothetical protein PTE31013_00095 [Pandoraea terrigena]